MGVIIKNAYVIYLGYANDINKNVVKNIDGGLIFKINDTYLNNWKRRDKDGFIRLSEYGYSYKKLREDAFNTVFNALNRDKSIEWDLYYNIRFGNIDALVSDFKIEKIESENKIIKIIKKILFFITRDDKFIINTEKERKSLENKNLKDLPIDWIDFILRNVDKINLYKIIAHNNNREKEYYAIFLSQNKLKIFTDTCNITNLSNSSEPIETVKTFGLCLPINDKHYITISSYRKTGAFRYYIPNIILQFVS